MLTKPRTVCACHLVAAIISARAATLTLFIIAMTSAILLLHAAAGLLAGFLAQRAFFAGFAFLTRFVFGGPSVADVFFRFGCAVQFVSPDRVAVVTIHHSG
jgi:hypothetical protein